VKYSSASNAKLVCRVLRQVSERAAGWDKAAKSGRRRWTLIIKQALADAGRKRQYEVYGSQIKNADGGEWLYDMCWLRYDRRKSHKPLRSLEMALESEWSRNDDEVLGDFEKLVVSKAKLKVVICDALVEAEVDDVFSWLPKVVGDYEDPGNQDCYLFCVLDRKKNKFRFSTVPEGLLTQKQRVTTK